MLPDAYLYCWLDFGNISHRTVVRKFICGSGVYQVVPGDFRGRVPIINRDRECSVIQICNRDWSPKLLIDCFHFDGAWIPGPEWVWVLVDIIG